MHEEAETVAGRVNTGSLGMVSAIEYNDVVRVRCPTIWSIASAAIWIVCIDDDFICILCMREESCG